MKKKILMIEDDDSLRIMVRKLLEGAGYEVIEEGNSKDGTARAIAEKPDLILMDVRLPSKKRGIGAARILRNHDATRDTPIIFVSGYVQGEEATEVKNIPNCSYILKPFENKQLLSAIATHLK